MPAGDDLDLLVAAAREAADLALTYFGQDPRSWAKGATSIVSEADYAVDRLLDRASARGAAGLWLALRGDGRQLRSPRAAARSSSSIRSTGRAPSFPAEGNGACRWRSSRRQGRSPPSCSRRPLAGFFAQARARGRPRTACRLRTSGRARLAGARFAGPRRFARPAAEAAGVPVDAVRFVPSLAYRLALVASGDVDVAISGPNAHDWDIAAADLLVHEAGGILCDLAGARPRYNRPGTTHPVLIASAAAIAGEVTALIRDWQDEHSESR